MVAALFLLVVLGVGILVLYPAFRRSMDDPGYAERIFADVLAHDRVLASRRWHRFGAKAWDCTYAIVEIPKTAPPDPPTKGYDGRPWFLRYGGEWQPTPLPPLGSTTRDALSFCARYWEEALADRLQAALAEPGHWAARDQVGETVSIYAPKLGVAARVRFGD